MAVLTKSKFLSFLSTCVKLLAVTVMFAVLISTGCVPSSSYQDLTTASNPPDLARKTLVAELARMDIIALRDVEDADLKGSYVRIDNSIATEDSLKIIFDEGEIRGKTSYTLRFADLVGKEIVVKRSDRFKWEDYYAIRLPGIQFLGSDMSDVDKFANALVIIRDSLRKKLSQRCDALRAEAGNFAKLAESYRNSPEKPTLSEEQRRLVVQANARNKRKEYDKAINLFTQVIQLDPTSYPAAYYNLALLAAQTEDYCSASTYMKQYLLLVPDAKDARTAQDKIYEWEMFQQDRGF